MKLIISEDTINGTVKEYELNLNIVDVSNMLRTFNGESLFMHLKHGGILCIGSELLKKSILEFKP